MLSIFDRWKEQDELDTYYTYAEAIASGEETLEEAEKMFNDPVAWLKFLRFFEKYQKTHPPQRG